MLNPPNPSTQFVWSPASVPAGTEIVFVMSDSTNCTGGASGIKVSSSTGDTSCLNSNSPSVTLQGSSSTTSIPVTQTSTASSLPSSGSNNNAHSTTFVTIIAGVVAELVALVALGIFLLCRYRGNQSGWQKRHFELDVDYHDEPSIVPYAVNPLTQKRGKESHSSWEEREAAGKANRIVAVIGCRNTTY